MAGSKQLLGVGVGLALVALLALAWWWHATLRQALPPREELPTRRQAMAAAIRFALDHGGTLTEVLGTGSMAPYIAARTDDGAQGHATVVAIVVTRAGATFDDIRRGALCTYTPEGRPREIWLHQAAQQDGQGWIMSGLNNPRSESWWRVTRGNFRGIVAKTFVWHTE